VHRLLDAEGVCATIFSALNALNSLAFVCFCLMRCICCVSLVPLIPPALTEPAKAHMAGGSALIRSNRPPYPIPHGGEG
jgi:hypothetical protein